MFVDLKINDNSIILYFSKTLLPIWYLRISFPFHASGQGLTACSNGQC